MVRRSRSRDRVQKQRGRGGRRKKIGIEQKAFLEGIASISMSTYS